MRWMDSSPPSFRGCLPCVGAGQPRCSLFWERPCSMWAWLRSGRVQSPRGRTPPGVREVNQLENVTTFHPKQVVCLELPVTYLSFSLLRT